MSCSFIALTPSWKPINQSLISRIHHSPDSLKIQSPNNNNSNTHNMRNCLLLSVTWNSYFLFQQQRVLGFSPVCVTTTTTTITTTTAPLPSQSRTKKPFFLAASTPLNAEAQFLEENINADYSLSAEQVKAVIQVGKEPKTKVINTFGFWSLIVSLIISPVWFLALKMAEAAYKMNEDLDPNREFFDFLGKCWSKAWLTLNGCYPTFSGEVDVIKKGPHNKPCLFVANHASWLDIPILSSETNQVFKFMAKKELGTLPCIGDQLRGGKHILIDRDNRRSQLMSFKQAVEWIDKGVPIMAFPEGRRSEDGHLLDFKGGPFAIAIKTSVPIVPITLAHTHAVMPSNALFPVQIGNGKLHVHVHEPIPVEGKTDKDLEEEVRKIFMSTLPKCQHPVEEKMLQLAKN